MADDREALHRRISELTTEIRQLRQEFVQAMGGAKSTRRVLPQTNSDDRQPPPVKRRASKKR